MAQRLARQLCLECREEFTPNPEHLKAVNFPAVPKSTKLFRPVGCSHCANTGYRGRLAIQEVMFVSEAIEQMVLDRTSSTDIENQAISEGMVTLREDGYAKVMAGLTSVEEVLRVIA